MSYLAKTPEGLLPCPHCGGEADVHYFAHDDSECTVMCSNPNCRASVSARSCGSMTTAYNRARKLWNRRAERTCRVESSHVEWERGAYSYLEVELSCGHAFTWDDGRPPDFCPYCGARVIGEETGNADR